MDLVSLARRYLRAVIHETPPGLLVIDQAARAPAAAAAPAPAAAAPGDRAPGHGDQAVDAEGDEREHEEEDDDDDGDDVGRAAADGPAERERLDAGRGGADLAGWEALGGWESWKHREGRGGYGRRVAYRGRSRAGGESSAYGVEVQN
ncbi:hypothetical protein JHW43_002270 [Diplocarpon mali]|nr:hypothetical protein JHW43_002270 [Diplocarpon mali]